jgi:tyrosinase
MARTRTEIRALGDVWNPTMLWYAKAVQALNARALTDKTGWLYLAAIHGFDVPLWQGFNLINAGTALPPPAEQDAYWNQCQHQTWYFLPWHRAYLLTFEDILRAWIMAQPGAPQDWALPYWNYSASPGAANPNPLAVPDAFTAQTLPDGTPNPLFVAARFGAAVAAQDAQLSNALLDPTFTGAAQEGNIPGFGGPQTPFSHAGEDGGWLEDQPHNPVHVDVGGQDTNGNGGMMTDPRSAAADPIFWVHHANIDRLWEVWRQRNTSDANPTDPAWLNGPTDQPFRLYDANGTDRPSNPKDVIGLVGTVYSYDDLSDPFEGTTRRGTRLAQLAPQAARILQA